MTATQEAKLDELLRGQAAMEAYQKTHARQLADHAQDIKDLQAHKNRSVGVAAAFSLLFTAIGHYINKII